MSVLSDLLALLSRELFLLRAAAAVLGPIAAVAVWQGRPPTAVLNNFLLWLSVSQAGPSLAGIASWFSKNSETAGTIAVLVAFVALGFSQYSAFGATLSVLALVCAAQTHAFYVVAALGAIALAAVMAWVSAIALDRGELVDASEQVRRVAAWLGALLWSVVYTVLWIPFGLLARLAGPAMRQCDW